MKEVSRKQTEVEDMREILRGVNNSAQNSTHQFEDKFKSEIQILNEELLLHRANNGHLNETLKTTVFELNSEKQKSRGFERQLDQFQNESVNLLKQRDELRRELSEALKLMDENKKTFEALLTDKGWLSKILNY